MCIRDSPDIVSRFSVMGGECNYLLEPRVVVAADGLSPRVKLMEVPDSEWKDGRGVRWDHADVARLLDAAEASLRETAARLGLRVTVVRKERAVGIVADSHAASSASLVAAVAGEEHGSGAYGRGAHISYEALEEAALAVQAALAKSAIPVPFCAFNGGRDVFIDVGHKALGIRALQHRVGAYPGQTVHAGDRFTTTGAQRRAKPA